MFESICVNQLAKEEQEGLAWLPESRERLIGNRDESDKWVHKFCSKIMHPTAVMIVVPEAIADPPKRTTLCFAGLQYLGTSYNFLVNIVFLR
jgi:hypothetical protein